MGHYRGRVIVAQQTALGRELTQRPDNRYASLDSKRRHPTHLRVIKSIDGDDEDADEISVLGASLKDDFLLC